MNEPTLTSEIASRVRGVSMHSGAKALVTKGDKTWANYLFVMPADMKLCGSAAKRACGESVAGSLTDSVSMRYEDWLVIEKPVVIEIANVVEEETKNGP
ncbi:MAG: hypothetical protein NUV84_05050 [Candidatus Uhrbacteria bacterium]|nr:hypothetical protein [Candidatus Uhrbacteria bacterium]